MKNFMNPLIVSGMLVLCIGAGCGNVADADYDGIPDDADCDPQRSHADKSDLDRGCGCDGIKAITTCTTAPDGGTVVITDGGVDAGTPASREGEQRACGSKDTNGVLLTKGECRIGFQTFTNGDWGTCTGAVGPITETCNGRDDDCDGQVDEDFDVGKVCTAKGECGTGTFECDGLTASRCDVAPGGSKDTSKPELCNGKDDDCDGDTDENFFVGAPCQAPGLCAATPGTLECATVTSTRCDTGPGGSKDASKTEVCDANLTDEDCDGSANEGCTCAQGSAPVSCGTNNVGTCRLGTQTCQPDGTLSVCVGNIDPGVEICNGLDDDCDGSHDEDFFIGTVCTGVGACGLGNVECATTTSTRCDVNPGGSKDASKPELCNGKDDDCDGAIDEDFFVGAPCTGKGECGQTPGTLECVNATATRCSTEPGGTQDASNPELCDANFADEDCDGARNEGCECRNGDQNPCGPKDSAGNFLTSGRCRVSFQVCTNGTWGACTGAVFPTSESCNGVDDDCDGQVDEDYGVGDTCTAKGECGVGLIECSSPTSARCDVAPGGSKDTSKPELCNGKDDDCDGDTDENFFVGAPCQAPGLCAATPGTLECATVTSTRCDTGPGGSKDASKTEVCDANLVDEDCDGIPNKGCACTPGSAPIACGLSNVNGCRFGTQTCQSDGTFSACVGNIDPGVETCNGVDDDCDGQVDEDFRVGDSCTGVGACGLTPGTLECASTTSVRCDVNPGGSKDTSKPELCNGKDDDCDGDTDENFFVGAPCQAPGLCAATPGTLECATVTSTRCDTGPGGSLDASKTEVCDANLVDEDCDGSANEGCACTPGSAPIVCGVSNVGECRFGSQVCQSNGTRAACSGNVDPTTDVCNGLDDDCDGQVDEDYPVGLVCTGVGACGSGRYECASTTSVRCDVNPGGSKSKVKPEVCNGLDDDCDGQEDEGFFIGAPCTGKGECGQGVRECDTTTTTRCSTAPDGSADQSSPEVCDSNRKDEDCDGAQNESCQCTPGSAPIVCGVSNVGECRFGSQVCQSDGTLTACSGNVDPATTDVCDGEDDDCNGVVDDGFNIGAPCVGIGACGVIGVIECATAAATRCSTMPGGSNRRDVTETCNGIDDDCDGTIDNVSGVVCPPIIVGTGTTGSQPPSSSFVGNIDCQVDVTDDRLVNCLVTGAVSLGLNPGPAGSPISADTIAKIDVGQENPFTWLNSVDVALPPPLDHPVDYIGDNKSYLFSGLLRAGPTVAGQSTKNHFAPRVRDASDALLSYFQISGNWSVTGSAARYCDANGNCNIQIQ